MPPKKKKRMHGATDRRTIYKTQNEVGSLTQEAPEVEVTQEATMEATQEMTEDHCTEEGKDQQSMRAAAAVFTE